MRVRFCLLLLFIFPIPFVVHGEQQTPKIGGKSGEARIESDYSLSFPPELSAEAVWQYLNELYKMGEPQYILSKYLNLSTKFSDEFFEDTYFDNASWQILTSDSGIRHRTRMNATDNNDRKNGRELIQVKLKPYGENQLYREEIKFPVKHYARAKQLLDSDPLYSLLKRSKREALRDEIVDKAHFNNEGWRSVIVLNQRRRRVYISRGGSSYMTVTVDEATSKKYWKTIHFIQMEFELGEIAYTSSDPAHREEMQKIRKLLIDDILKRFPTLKLDTTPKYQHAFHMFEQKIPLFKFLIGVI